MTDIDSPVPYEEPPRRPGLGAAVAIGSTGVALALALVLRPVLLVAVAPLFILAVGVTALLAGLAPALFAAVLAAVTVNFWLYPPYQTFGFAGLSDLLQQLVFWTSAILIAVIVAQARLSRLTSQALSDEALRLRIAAEERRHEAEALLTAGPRRHAALADLAQAVLGSAEPQSVLDAAGVTVAATLDLPLTGILELLPTRDALLLRAGQGWRDGVVGQARVGAAPDSLTGRALTASGPLVFRNPSAEIGRDGEILEEHGVTGGVLVAMHSVNRPVGLVGAFTTGDRELSAHEISFLEAVAELVAATLRGDRMEQLFRENPTDAVVILDREWRLTFANTRAEEIAGRPARELWGQTIWEVMPALVGTDYEQELRRAMELQVSTHTEFLAPGFGRLEIRAYPHRDGLALVWTDATPQRRALAAAGAGTWEWDLDTGELVLSPAAGELHGVSTAHAISLEELLEAIHPVDREQVRSSLARSASDRVDCTIEYRVPRPGETTRLVAARGGVVDDGTSAPRRIAGIVMELAEYDPFPVQSGEHEQEPGSEGHMVLVVKGDAAARQLACQALEREGYRWLSAGDAAEALVLLERYDRPIDLLVTDARLPDTSGSELAGRVRERFPEVAVLYSTEASGSDAAGEGEDGLIQKVRERLAVSPPWR
jgi:PAS domain-containing protein/CheY-like chemotaxis protein